MELFFKNFTYLFLAVLGLRCCVGFSLVAASRLLIEVVSLVAQASVFVAHGLSRCGSWAVEHWINSCGPWA